MNKNYLSCLVAAFFSVVLLSGTANSGSLPALKLYENPGFEILKDYNVRLTSYKGGVSSYSGIKGDLRVKIKKTESKTEKVVFVFDNDVSSGDRKAILADIIDISNQLFPQQISTVSTAADSLMQKINVLVKNGGKDVFMLDRLRVELNLNNNVLNMWITPQD